MKPAGDSGGGTVLLVEDETLVSMLAEEILLDAGFKVLLAMRLAEALRIAQDEPIDCAILDVNLGDGERSYPVAEALQARAIPFVFVTGYGAGGTDPAFADRPVLQKPYAPAALVEAVRGCLARQDETGRPG